MEVGNGEISTTQKVWAVLCAAHAGDVARVKELVSDCPGLIYAQYNYTPPIHFAVREGHVALVEYLLNAGAYDPDYRFYPFRESLESVAEDRGHTRILTLLTQYAADPARKKYSGDNGQIFYPRTPLQTEFERAVDRDERKRVGEILAEHPEFALDPTYFWSEGILTVPAKRNYRAMVDLLMSYGAKAPDILKWTQFYYFERYDAAEYMMGKGMNPNVMSWQRVTLLHDMAQKGFVDKAALLIRHGANLDAVDDAYCSTPLGMAARWGQTEMVAFLLRQGADPNISGAHWATPLHWAKTKRHPEIGRLLINAGAHEL
jgi:ankyrin repeat protein